MTRIVGALAYRFSARVILTPRITSTPSDSTAYRRSPSRQKLTATTMVAATGYVTGRPPRDRAFKPALDLEVERMRAFLG